MSYVRVIPRDLFNESKLLKCLGQLSLLILDGKTRGVPMELIHNDNKTKGFDIDQDGSRALFYCTNVFLSIDGRQEYVGIPVNSRSAYPLVLIDHGETKIEVLNSAGSLSNDFVRRFKREEDPDA